MYHFVPGTMERKLKPATLPISWTVEDDLDLSLSDDDLEITDDEGDDEGEAGTPVVRIIKENEAKPSFCERESDTLREELKAVHDACMSKIVTLEDKNIELLELTQKLYDDKEMFEDVSSSLREENDDLEETIYGLEMDAGLLEASEEEWIGRALKYQFLFQKMKEIGLQQSEDIFDLFEDIDIPEVSIRVKDKFVPTTLTDNIDWDDADVDDVDDVDPRYLPTDDEDSDDDSEDDDDDEDGEEYYEYRVNGTTMSVYNDMTDRYIICQYEADREIVEKSVQTIQKVWSNYRGVIKLKKEQLDLELDVYMGRRRVFDKWEWDSDGFHDDYAKVIQRVWRGYRMRDFLRISRADQFHHGREDTREAVIRAHNIYHGLSVPELL
jgi:hypothetical protein